jgi:phage tail sheath protein FI
MITQAGAINTTALIVPDLYVQVVPPQVALLNGVPTNVLGLVGTASWGPLDSPVVCGSMADYAAQFGPVVARGYDLGTALAAAVLQGANNFRCVRVSDGSETTASAVISSDSDYPGTVAITFSSRYPGALANSDTVTLATGSKAGTWRAIVARPGLVPEVFDNISGVNALFWVNLADAINNGTGPLRGPSQLIVADAGGAPDAVVAATYTLAGGTDGVASITGGTLLGQDVMPRKGMYALRNTGASVAVLVDCADTTTFAEQLAYGLSEGSYMIGVTASGDSIGDGSSTGAVYTKNRLGIDSYAFKYLFGDWVYFNDTVNGLVRLVSPQGFVAGRLVALSPEQSALNKPLYGIVGTQKSRLNQVYSAAELQLLIGAGIDLITNPVPGGNYFGLRAGHNSSSNPLTHGDNYTRLTNYVASTLNAGMGQFIGQLQTTTERSIAKAMLEHFLQNMLDAGMIGDVNGGPAYSVVLDASNNPGHRVALGYQQADVRIRYLSVVEKFLVNVEGSTATVIPGGNPALVG